MKPLPNIGFDRFITRSWLDLALDIAAGQRERADLVALLEQDIVGIEARSKTSIILNRMWLSPHPSLRDYAAAGVAIYKADSDIDTMSLHWGIRPIAQGRSAWLFAGSLRAGQRGAAIMSLIQSAKLNGHDPYAYLKDVLTRLPTQPASRIEELLPHLWQNSATR